MPVKISEASIMALMARQGIKTKTKLAARCKWSPQTLDRLIKNRRRTFSSSNIDRLCSALECQPGAFLEYVPDEPE